MTVAIQDISANFFGCFKVGDNTSYNSRVLCALVAANQNSALNKPIVLQVGSILEACLSQIIYRVQRNCREGVPRIEELSRREIAGKKIDKFNSIIDTLKKHRILNGLGEQIYEDLHLLRKYRNKFHIQDSSAIPGSSAKEEFIFTDDVCEWSLTLYHQIAIYLSSYLARPNRLNGYVRPLSIPHPFDRLKNCA